MITAVSRIGADYPTASYTALIVPWIYMFPIDAITTYFDFTEAGTKTLVSGNDPKTILSFSIYNDGRTISMACGSDSFSFKDQSTIQDFVSFYCPYPVTVTSNGDKPIGFMTYVPRDIRIVAQGASSTISNTVELGPNTSEGIYGIVLVFYIALAIIILLKAFNSGMKIIKI